MLSYLAVLIFGIFLSCCFIAVCASCRQLFKVIKTKISSTGGSQRVTRPIEI